MQERIVILENQINCLNDQVEEKYQKKENIKT